MAADFVAGMNGGVAGVLVGHPFDTVKIRLQTQDPLKPRYHGIYHCFSLIAKQETLSLKRWCEGVYHRTLTCLPLPTGMETTSGSVLWEEAVEGNELLGLYKGMGTPIISVAFLASVLFGSHGFFLRRLDERKLSHHALAGALSGSIRSCIACPIDVSKIVVQVQGIGKRKSASNKPEFSGSVDAFFKILRARGLRGIYRGLRITLIRDIPGFAIYFSTFEGMCRIFRDYSHERRLPIKYLILAGGTSGICTWLFIYPVDVMKSRYQKASTAKCTERLSYRQLIETSYSAEGARVFTRGLSVSLIRAFPTCAAIFTTVSLTKRVLLSN